jgi:hypothetical protein
VPKPKKRPTEKKTAADAGVRVVRPKGTRIVASPAPAKIDAFPKGSPGPDDRRQAGLLYALDPEKRTARYIHETYFPHLFFKTVEHWRLRDDWEGMRSKFWSAVDGQVMRDYQSRMVQQMLGELDNLEDFSKTLHGQFKNGKTITITAVGDDGKEKTIEVPEVPLHFDKRSDAIRTFLMIDKRIDEKRESILTHAPVAATGSNGPPLVKMNLTPEEARAMALARLQVAAAKQLPEGLSAAVDAPEVIDVGDDEP